MKELSDELLQLVRDCAPILIFHPREGSYCCYPADAEETYEMYSSDWSQFKEDRTPSELDHDTPCYFETWEGIDMTQIRYWFWYRFNRFPVAPFKLGDHLGDWEHVEVRIFPNLEIGKVVMWLYSNHLGARLSSEPLCFTLEGFDCENHVITKRHIHAWVALGSHAHYPSPESKPYCYKRVLCDKIEAGGVSWNTWNNLIALKDTRFVAYKGRWGDERAPRSPTNDYNNRWRNAPNLRPIEMKRI